MFVSGHDAALMGVLLAYAASVGTAAALTLAGEQSAAVERLAATARRLAAGDLDARRPGALEVAVSDTGEGIPADALERVFDPLWRGDDARSSPGSGLGLALARRIVRAMGGHHGGVPARPRVPLRRRRAGLSGAGGGIRTHDPTITNRVL